MHPPDASERASEFGLLEKSSRLVPTRSFRHKLTRSANSNLLLASRREWSPFHQNAIFCKNGVGYDFSGELAFSVSRQKKKKKRKALRAKRDLAARNETFLLGIDFRPGAHAVSVSPRALWIRNEARASNKPSKPTAKLLAL